MAGEAGLAMPLAKTVGEAMADFSRRDIDKALGG